MPMVFNYLNYKGSIAMRTVEPLGLQLLRNPGFNYQPGWFLYAKDLDKNAERSFALSHIIVPEGGNGYTMVLDHPATGNPKLDKLAKYVGMDVGVEWIASAPGALSERRERAHGRLTQTEEGFFLLRTDLPALRVTEAMMVKRITTDNSSRDDLRKQLASMKGLGDQWREWCAMELRIQDLEEFLSTAQHDLPPDLAFRAGELLRAGKA